MVGIMSQQQQQPLITTFASVCCLSYWPALDETALIQRTSLVTQYLYQLPNLTALQLTLDVVHHRTIDVPDLRLLTNLRALSLRDNNLITLPSLSPLAHALTELDLSGSVQRLAWNALKGFTALRSLALVDNHNYHAGLFETFSSLTRLDMRGHDCCREIEQGHALFARLALHTDLASLTLNANDFECMLMVDQTPHDMIAKCLPRVTRLTVLDHYQLPPFPLQK